MGPTLVPVHTTPPSFRDRHPALDGLRALAVMVVVVFHFLPGLLPYRLMELGWAGVDLFFVLSGFLITGILLDTRERQGRFRTFIVRRALRVLPLSYGLMAVVFIVAAVTDHPGLRITADHQLWFWTYTQNLWIAFEGWPKDLGIFNHFWSLAVEEQFYLFWPLVVWALPTRRLPWVLLPALALGPLLRHLHPEMPFAFAFTFSRLDGLLIGSLLAWTLRAKPGLLVQWWRTGALLTVLAVVALLGAVITTNEPFHPWVVRWGPLVFSLLSACLVLQGISYRGRLGRPFQALFTWKPVRAIGRISYGIYVLHWPVMLVMRTAMEHLVLQHGWPQTATNRALIVLYLPMVLLISMASYHLWEKHFLRLKDRWAPYR